MRIAYGVIVAAVAVFSFWDAPWRLRALRRSGRVGADPAYHLVNALTMAVAAAWVLPVFLARVEQPLLGPGEELPLAARFAGLAVAGAGAALGLWARASLSPAFAPTLTKTLSRSLVTPRALRVGPLGRGLGVARLAGHPRGAGNPEPHVWFLAVREEAALREGAGQAYEDYARRVPRDVPRLRAPRLDEPGA